MGSWGGVLQDGQGGSYVRHRIGKLKAPGVGIIVSRLLGCYVGVCENGVIGYSSWP